MKCYRKILHISFKDHVTNEEVHAKIQQATGPHEGLLTIVKRRKLQWYGHVSRSSGLAENILQGTVKGGRRQGRQRKRWEDNHREWTGHDACEVPEGSGEQGKWRKLVVKSTMVPQRPSRLRDWWWWSWSCTSTETFKRHSSNDLLHPSARPPAKHHTAYQLINAGWTVEFSGKFSHLPSLLLLFCFVNSRSCCPPPPGPLPHTHLISALYSLYLCRKTGSVSFFPCWLKTTTNGEKKKLHFGGGGSWNSKTKNGSGSK